MPLDYGQRVQERRVPLERIAAFVFAGLLILAFPVCRMLQWPRTVPEARAWTIVGPPCPSVSAARFRAEGLEAPLSFEFRDVRVSRRFGYASCQAIRYGGGRGIGDYPVCQFTGPVTLIVSTGRRDAYYVLGVGQPATIQVRRGRPECILGSHFTVAAELGRQPLEAATARVSPPPR